MNPLHRRLLRGAVAGLFLLVVVTVHDSSGQVPQTVLQTFKGHTDPVYAVAFSPDSRYVVTGSFDKTARVWDATNGKEFRSYGGPQGHQNLVLAIAVNGTGTEFATGSSDNTAKTWDFPGQTPIKTVDLPAEGLGLTLSADGQKAAVALKDGTVKVYNQADGKELFVLKGHAGPVTQVALSANNQHLVTVGSDRTIRFWNPADGKPIAVYGAHAGPITGMTIRPDSNGVVTASEDGSVKLWNVPGVGSRGLAAPHGGTVSALALSNDGNQIFTASADKTIRQSQTANGQQVRVFGPAAGMIPALAVRPDLQIIAGGLDTGLIQFWTGNDGKDAGKVFAHDKGVGGLAFNPANNTLVSVGGDGLLRTWAQPLLSDRTLVHPDATTAAIASADGKRVFTAAGDKTIYGWNLTAPQAPERKFPGHPTLITALALRGDGQLLVSAGEDGILRFWNATNSQPGETILGHVGAVTSLSFTPDSQKVMSSGVDGAVRLWQVPTTPAVKPLAHPDAVLAAIPSPDGANLLTSGNDKQVRLWNLQNFQARTYAGLAQPAKAIAMSPNGGLVAAGSPDKVVIVWSTGDAKEQAKLTPPAAVQSLAFHPDNKTLAVGLVDGAIVVYDIAQKKEVKSLKGHGGAVNALAFLPTGDLVSGSADKSVQVWNPGDGKSKAKLDTPAPVVDLSVSKDGKVIATAGADRNVKFWTLADKKEVGSFVCPAEVRGIGLSPDGQRAAIAGADKLVRVVGIDGHLVESFAHEGIVAASGFLPDGKRVYSAGADKTARLFTPALLWQGHHAGPVRQAVLNGKGDRIASAGDDKQVVVWNVADGKQIEKIAAEGPVVGLAINTDATRLGLAVGSKVELADLTKKGARVATYTLPAAATRIAMSPNGTRLAAGFSDKTTPLVHVWDVTPGKEGAVPLQVLTDCTAALRDLSFLADNRTLLTAEAGKDAHLLDVAATSVLKVHDGAVTGVTLNNNGTQAVTSGADKLVKHWDLAQGKVIRSFGPLPATATAATFARDYSQLAAASGKQIKVWNAADGKELATLESPAEVKSLSFNGDKTRLASAGADGNVRVWDVVAKTELVFFPHAGGAVEAVAFHPNNTNVIAGGADKTALIHTITLNRVIAVGSPVRGLGISGNSAQVVTGADDKSVKVWNTGNGNMERAFGAGEAVGRAVAITRNNVAVVVAGSDKQLRVYQLNDAKLVGAAPLLAESVSLTTSPDSKSVTVAGKDGSVATYSIAFNQGQPLPPEFGKLDITYHHAGEAAEAVFSNDGKTLITTGTDKKFQTWKMPASTPTRNFGHPGVVHAVAFAPDGKMLATGCQDGKLRFFDLAKNNQAKEVNAFPAPATPPNSPPGAIYALTYTPDGKQVLIGGLDRSAKLYDAASGGLVREFKAYKEKDFPQGHKDGIYCVATSPDGKLIVTGSSDRTIKIWNPADGSVVRTLTNSNLKPAGPMSPPPSHPGAVYGVRFIENGQKLLTVGPAPRGMGFLAVWNVADGALVHAEEVPIGTLFALAVSADGSKIALGTGASVRTAGDEGNNAYLMQTPKK